MKIFKQQDRDIINDKMRQIKMLLEDSSHYSDNITRWIRIENKEKITCLAKEISYIIETEDKL